MIDHAAAGRVDGASGALTLNSRWRRSRRYRCGFFPGRASRNVPPTPWHAWTVGAAALRAGRRPRTPLRHRRDTSRIPAAARAPPSRAAFRKPHETASPPRAHPPASARGQTTRALPWEEAKARLLRLGIKGAQQPARARELFPSPARARRAWTSSNDHGFFCYSVQIWRIRKKAALPPTDPLSQASV